MKFNVYLGFDGRCKEAFEFYQSVLGGKIDAMIPHAGTPAEGGVPPEWKDKIMHARMTVDGNVLMGGDAPPQHQKKPQGFSVNIGLDNVSDAERIYATLSKDGQVMMPLAPTFWAERFAMFIDRYGTPWMINVEKAGGPQ